MREGISFFSVNDQDIEYVKTPQMKINWKDQVRVQQNYNSISKQLYNEIKYNIEDLLNKQWIIHSHSEYSSPVVAARKKDGTIRLCCDYRKLNQKTIPDRHPLPRIQNVIDNLGGNKFFSLLDQSKSYHQLHLNPEGRWYIAFITPWGFTSGCGCLSDWWMHLLAFRYLWNNA